MIPENVPVGWLLDLIELADILLERASMALEDFILERLEDWRWRQRGRR